MESSQLLVDKVISPTESFFRCIFSPLHISSAGKIKREALLPPRERRDVSMFRKRYLSIDECLTLAKDISFNNNTLKALASISNDAIETNNLEFKDQQPLVYAHVFFTPMHNEMYVDTGQDIFMNDPKVNKAAHVDLIYNYVYTKDELVQTKLRKYASELIKSMKKELIIA